MSMPKSVTQYLAEIGARGGKAKSKVKAAAVRENGRKGGRPRKVVEQAGAAGVSDTKGERRAR